LLSSGIDILNPINAGGGGTGMFMLSAKYFQGKNNATPADGTAVGSAGNVPTDLYGVNTFSQATAANRPLFKTTEGFKTIQIVDNTDGLSMVNTLDKNATSILYGYFGKVTSHNAGSNNYNVSLFNAIGNAVRFAVFLNESDIRFITNINDSSTSGQNTLTTTEQTDYKNTYFTLLCYQNYIDGTKWMYFNNRLFGSTTTSFGAAIPNTNSTAPFALGFPNNTVAPPNHCKVAFMVKNFASNPTTDEIRKINNFLIHN